MAPDVLDTVCAGRTPMVTRIPSPIDVWMALMPAGTPHGEALAETENRLGFPKLVQAVAYPDGTALLACEAER